jgi:hypothetical protein
MKHLPTNFPFGMNFDFGDKNVFQGFIFSNNNAENMVAPFPPTPGNFLLLDGTDFLLLDGTDFLLL